MLTKGALKEAYGRLWEDAPAEFQEMKDHYSTILNASADRAVDDSLDSLIDAHETAKLSIHPPYNERNYVFNTFPHVRPGSGVN